MSGSRPASHEDATDFWRIFRGIHAPGTIEKNLAESQLVGRLDEQGAQ